MPALDAASSLRRLPWIVAAAAVLAAVCLGLQAHWWRQQARAEQTERDLAEVALQLLQSRFNERTLLAEGLINDLQQRLTRQQDISRLRVVLLTPPADAPSTTVAVVVLDAERQSGLLVADHLPLLPTDQDYHLWIIDSARTPPSDAGIVTPTTDGRALLAFKFAAAPNPGIRFGLGQKISGAPPATPGPYLLLSR
jgi:hypothetical protein